MVQHREHGDRERPLHRALGARPHRRIQLRLLAPFMVEDDTRVKRVRVIVNPHGGKGDAQQVFNTRILPLLQLAGIQCDLEITKYYGR